MGLTRGLRITPRTGKTTGANMAAPARVNMAIKGRLKSNSNTATSLAVSMATHRPCRRCPKQGTFTPLRK